jgi:hypothetical protein
MPHRELLYSLEVLATNVLVYDSDRPRIATPALAVRLLDYPSLILRADARAAERPRDDGAHEVVFQTGKSCLFHADPTSLDLLLPQVRSMRSQSASTKTLCCVDPSSQRHPASS